MCVSLLTLLPSNRYTLTSYHTYCVIDEVHIVAHHPHILCRAIHLPRVHHSRHVRMSEVKCHSNVCGIGYMPGERRIDIVRTRFASSTNQRIYMNSEHWTSSHGTKCFIVVAEMFWPDDESQLSHSHPPSLSSSYPAGTYQNSGIVENPISFINLKNIEWRPRRFQFKYLFSIVVHCITITHHTIRFLLKCGLWIVDGTVDAETTTCRIHTAAFECWWMRFSLCKKVKWETPPLTKWNGIRNSFALCKHCRSSSSNVTRAVVVLLSQ